MKKYNFSRKHWMNILLCFFLLILNNVCTTDGENVILPRLAQANGWDYTKVLMLASAAGCLSVVGQLLIGKICARKGAKFTIVLCMFLTAGCLILYGSANHMWVYALGLFGVICCSTSYSYIGANALIANWFPRKKGIAMGFVSVGAPVSTIVMVSTLTFLINAVGLLRGVMIISLVLVAVAVICIFAVHDKPEMCGETPDNISREELEQVLDEEEHTAVISVKELIRKKETWYIVFMMGVCSLGLTGVMAQFVVRYTQSGFSEPTAILMMSSCAAVGIFGSMFMGNVENRLGTQKAYMIFALVFATALAINFTNVLLLILISIVMFGCVITILQIFLTSFQVSVFGRTNFKQANALIFPLVSMIGQLSLLIISACIRIFGEVRYAYLVFAVLFIVTLFFNRKIRIESTTA